MGWLAGLRFFLPFDEDIFLLPYIHHFYRKEREGRQVLKLFSLALPTRASVATLAILFSFVR
jgi:hypothetical protein